MLSSIISHVTHSNPEIAYDSAEANSILSRSLSLWRASLRLAKSILGFLDSSFKLEKLPSRIPLLPNDIPTSSALIEGYSTWKYSDASCPLVQSESKPGSHPNT
jgi:hypothetical protein